MTTIDIYIHPAMVVIVVGWLGWIMIKTIIEMFL